MKFNNYKNKFNVPYDIFSFSEILYFWILFNLFFGPILKLKHGRKIMIFLKIMFSFHYYFEKYVLLYKSNI